MRLPEPSGEVARGGRPQGPTKRGHRDHTAKKGKTRAGVKVRVIKMLKWQLPRPLEKVTKERQNNIFAQKRSQEFQPVTSGLGSWGQRDKFVRFIHPDSGSAHSVLTGPGSEGSASRLQGSCTQRSQLSDGQDKDQGGQFPVSTRAGCLPCAAVFTVLSHRFLTINSQSRLYLSLKETLFFRAVLHSMQKWMESTESAHLPLSL